MKNILLSAYLCEPNRGSEHGIGWNAARELARRDRVWVLAAECNQAAVEAEQRRDPNPNLTFEFVRLPTPLRRFPGQLRYLAWQFAAISVARRLHREIGFDVAQHVSFVRYWTPSALAFVPVPFVWGPVGGRERAPLRFDYGVYGTFFEILRRLVLGASDLNPLVWWTARRSDVAIATSPETERHLRRLGARRTEVMFPTGVPEELAMSPEELEGILTVDRPVRFISVTGKGRLMHWKGVHLGIRALAKARLDTAEFHVFGTGRELPRLKAMTEELGVADQVVFWGDVSREAMLEVFRDCDALIHPAVHDAGATTIPEAFALATPVDCLDVGGAAIHVTESTGFHASTKNVEAAVADLAHGMRVLATDPERRNAMRRACLERAVSTCVWGVRANRFRQIHDRILAGRGDGFSPSVSLRGADGRSDT